MWAESTERVSAAGSGLSGLELSTCPVLRLQLLADAGSGASRL